ncbi:hypothetical protein [Enterococcus sp. RIT-PI-f]|uniref:hypothetical protein n=1 Tax=Enterococcus sp. RIT-PI-f TaxID=1690244 RepID=UPI0006B941E6|nr:hypothetical protein [Enterococcus sp. RIT-PI-f]KPG69505.1 hypothetical protein AEQ18_12430 [Enterococcus sp. RIT-PI-f]
MNGKFKVIVFVSILSLFVSLAYPGINILADEEQNGQVSLWDIEEENEVQYDKKEASATIDITKNKLIINGVTYNKVKLLHLLNTAYELSSSSSCDRQPRFAAVAGVYLIPGVGEVALAATGAIILGGVTIGAGHWAYKTITSYFSNKASGPVGKSNLKKQGRELNNKARNNKNFKSRSNKNPNRPMKKHTPSKKHNGGKQ